MRRLDSIMFSPLDTRPEGVGERRKQEKAYSFFWLANVFQGQGVEIKAGVGLLLATLVDGYHAFFTKVFTFAVLLWALDMVTGALRAFVDPSIRWRWSKAMDGLVRLLVICAIALSIAIAEQAVFELSMVDVSGKLLTIAYTFIIVAEFSSIIGNASYFYPQLNDIGEKFKGYFPKYNKEATKPEIKE